MSSGLKAQADHSLLKSNFLKFRCTLDSSIGKDTHRDFTGVYYPRFRSMYLDEVRSVIGLRGKNFKMFPQFPFDTYLKPEDQDYYMTDDFVPGAKISFGETRSSRDQGVKTFVITEVHHDNLRTPTASVKKYFAEKQLPENVLNNLIKVREAFIHHAGGVELGIKAAGRRFRVIDDSGDRKINIHEFQKAVHEVHIDLSHDEVVDVFNAFDANSDGVLSFNELLNVLRGPMSEARKQAVVAAFRKIDTNQDGTLTLHDLEVKYDVSQHPDIIAGTLTEQQVKNGFLAAWDTRERNGIITFAEFQDYYNGVSAGIDSDELFVAVIISAWNL